MNKQRVLFPFVLFFAFTYVKGQDLIFTKMNDTISCKIVSISLNYIKYEQQGYNQVTVSNTIPTNLVSGYSLGPRPESNSKHRKREQLPPPVQPPANKEQTPSVLPPPAPLNREQTPSSVPVVTKKEIPPSPAVKKRKLPQEPFPRWRVGFQGGGSYLLNSLTPLRQEMKYKGVSLPNEADNYYKQLRNGISAGADVHYLLTNSIGVGVKYSLFSSSVKMDYSVMNSHSTVPIYYSANEKEQFYLNYIGPSVFFRQWLGVNHKFSFNEELSLGYIQFRDEAKYDPYQYVFVNPETNVMQYNVLKEGSTFSGSLQLSFEYYPTSGISIGVNLGFIPAVFRTLRVSDNETSRVVHKLGEGNSLNMTRIDYSMGLRFHF